MKKVFILVIAGLTFSGYAQKGNVWSLEAVIQHALENNLKIKRSQLNISTNTSNLKQSKGSILPDLSANYGYRFNFGRSIDQTTNQFVKANTQNSNVSINSSVNLFNGFRNKNTITKSKLALQSSQYDLEATQNDITISVLNSYLTILINNENLNNLIAQLEVTKKQLKQIKAFVNAGVKTKQDQFELEAQIASENIDIINAQNNLDLAYLDLKQLLDLPYSTTFEVEIPTIQPILVHQFDSTSFQSILEQTLSNQPKIKSSETSVLTSEKEIAIQRSYQLPSLGATWSLSTFYSSRGLKQDGSVPIQQNVGYLLSNPSETVVADGSIPLFVDEPYLNQFNSNLGQAVGLRLSFPIFNRFLTKQNINRAKISYQDKLYSTKQIKASMEKEILTAITNTQASEKKYLSAIAKLKFSKSVFNLATKQYEQKIIPILDYISAKNKFSNAETSLLQAKYDFVFNTKILDFYNGEKISLN